MTVTLERLTRVVLPSLALGRPLSSGAWAAWCAAASTSAPPRSTRWRSSTSLRRTRWLRGRSRRSERRRRKRLTSWRKCADRTTSVSPVVTFFSLDVLLTLFNPGCQPLPLNDPLISGSQSYLYLSWPFFPQYNLKTAMNPSPSSSWCLTCKCNCQF